ncbi:MAG: copper homeostasis protein CutC [Planctomycetota bacterium]|nr:copper homeostasis protein CutC [Planctomycetota bacterium]
MLEVCVDTVQGAIGAEKAGADRIELCSALELGGVTPSNSLVSAVRAAIQLPFIVLIRSRAGDFFFDAQERDLMIVEAMQAIELGAEGVAIGGLTRSRELDLPLLRSARAALPKSQLVMHRAFDHVRDPLRALEELIAIGFTRILTSGGPNSALEGVMALKLLNESARNRIEILPAGGVNDDNAEQILTTCCTRGFGQLHGSFRQSLLPRNGYAFPDPASILRTKAVLSNFNRLDAHR